MANSGNAARDDQPAVSPAAALAAAPVRLTFEVGEASMPAEDLAKLDAGYLFILRTPRAHPVTIKANGVFFGRGELVQIDGALGVRLLEEPGNGP
jgi:type III secretion system YscQ/HrcQ family protein